MFVLKEQSKECFSAKLPPPYPHVASTLSYSHVLFSILQEPVRSLGPSIASSDTLNIFLTLPLPGISLLHICAKPVSPPQKVRLLQHFSNQILSNSVGTAGNKSVFTGYYDMQLKLTLLHPVSIFSDPLSPVSVHLY